ncbi:MAG: hypothetical protein M1812_006765 [Candelaria pacifica]|nr:MAG: hypothetical protein M1812_006765 [Candelaria pacifica]
MRTSVAQIIPTLSTLAVILFASIFLLPSTANAFPLSMPDMSSLGARAEYLTNEARDLDFSSLLQKRKSTSKVTKKKKKISGGAIAGIIIAIIVIVIIVAVVFFFLRKRKASGH